MDHVFEVEESSTKMPRWLVRLTARYWGRVLLLALGQALAFALIGLVEPQVLTPKFLGLGAVVVVVCATRNARQLRIAAVAPCVYLGARVKWTIEEPSFENLALFGFAALVVVLLVWLVTTFKTDGLLLGWLQMGDGRELPLILAPCACGKTDLLHYQVYSVSAPIALDPEAEYELCVPGAPRRLRVNLVLGSWGGHTYLKTLDSP